MPHPRCQHSIWTKIKFSVNLKNFYSLILTLVACSRMRHTNLFFFSSLLCCCQNISGRLSRLDLSITRFSFRVSVVMKARIYKTVWFSANFFTFFLFFHRGIFLFRMFESPQKDNVWPQIASLNYFLNDRCKSVRTKTFYSALFWIRVDVRNKPTMMIKVENRFTLKNEKMVVSTTETTEFKASKIPQISPLWVAFAAFKTTS